MTPRFSVDQVLFNRNTKEKGTVRRAYMSDGMTRYEVAVWVHQEFSGYYNKSDWDEDVLEIYQGHSPGEDRPPAEDKQKEANQ